jgi:ribosomal protein S27AE
MDEILSRGTCALCGKSVYLDDHGEGRVHCSGCQMATDNCTCTDE